VAALSRASVAWQQTCCHCESSERRGLWRNSKSVSAVQGRTSRPHVARNFFGGPTSTPASFDPATVHPALVFKCLSVENADVKSNHAKSCSSFTRSAPLYILAERRGHHMPKATGHMPHHRRTGHTSNPKHCSRPLSIPILAGAGRPGSCGFLGPIRTCG